MSENSKKTIIESGTEVEGSLKSDCDVTLSGKLSGDICAPNLTVTPYGSVEGNITVNRLKAEGLVAGKIEADEVALSGTVCDQTVIRANKFEVALAQQDGGMQVTFGNCDLRIGDPTAQQPEQSAKKKRATPETMTEEKAIQAVGDLIK